MYYDPAGRPITIEQWAAGFGMERHVGLTVLRKRGHWYRVSTVWLGLDHAFLGGPPLIFETMIFDESDRHQSALFDRSFPTDIAQWRYSTGEQAMRGHVRAVRWLKRNAREQHHPQLIHNGRKPIGRPIHRRK